MGVGCPLQNRTSPSRNMSIRAIVCVVKSQLYSKSTYLTSKASILSGTIHLYASKSKRLLKVLPLVGFLYNINKTRATNHYLFNFTVEDTPMLDDAVASMTNNLPVAEVPIMNEGNFHHIIQVMIWGRELWLCRLYERIKG